MEMVKRGEEDPVTVIPWKYDERKFDFAYNLLIERGESSFRASQKIF